MFKKGTAIKNKLLNVFSSSDGQDLTEQDYKKSRNLFIAEGSFAISITTMAGGVVVSGILKYLGATDAVNGIISGIPVSAGILLLFMPLIFRNLKRVKFVVTLFALIHRLLFSLMLAVPLIISDNTARLVTFVVIYTLGYMMGTFIGPNAANWLVSLVPARIRGRYLGLREGVMIASMTVVSVIIGMVIDHMKAIDQEAMGYFICTVVIFIFTVGNFLCLKNIKEPPSLPPRKKVTLKRIIKYPIQNKAFRKVLIFTALWSFGFQLGGPFFAIYFYSVLGLKYTYIMIMNVLMAVLRVAAAQLWGRLADRRDWAYVTKMSLIVLGAVHIGFLFMNTDTYLWSYPLLQMGSGVGWGGVAISIFNMQFEYAPEENRTSYIAVNNALASTVGFAAVLIGSAIVNKVGTSPVMIASLPIHGMQFLFLGSGLFILMTSLYIHKFISKKKES